jgi:hypothetical protein
MPEVRGKIRRIDDTDPIDLDRLGKQLNIACSELVAASFNSAEGPLIPREVNYLGEITSRMGADADVWIDVEAYDFPDRRYNLDERRLMLSTALGKIFPDRVIYVTCSLILAPSPPEPFKGEMTMGAAMQRVRAAIEAEQVLVAS